MSHKPPVVERLIENGPIYGGDISWVKSGELNDRYISQTEETLTSDGLKHSSAKLFPPGTLLMAMYGATVGKTAVLKKPAATNQAVCAIFPNAEKS
jgi:type I restriction enzyme S subunit